MHARVATFEEVDVDRAEGLAEETTDRLRSIIQKMEGWQGMLQLIDRSSRTQMLVHLFDSEENALAAEPTFEDMPNQVPEVREIAARRGSVGHYDVSFGVIRGQEL